MLKTLIVEDNATFRQSLKATLETEFPLMVIEEAEDGKEAMEKVTTFRPDLIFMDIKLPGETGLDLTKRIKTNDTSIVVIILTSYDLPEYREAAQQYGADYFVSKGSSTREEILELVRSISSNRGIDSHGP
jgi:DNA-binding NarL/FixJ family response regulator